MHYALLCIQLEIAWHWHWHWHRHCNWLYEINLNSHYESAHRLLHCWCRWWWWGWWGCWWPAMCCSFPSFSFILPCFSMQKRRRCAGVSVCACLSLSSVALSCAVERSFKPLGVACVNTFSPLLCRAGYARGVQSDLCELSMFSPSLSCVQGILSVDSLACTAPKCMLHLGII